MLVADVLIDSQIIGFTTIKFNRLSKCGSRPPRARGLKLCPARCQAPLMVAPPAGAWIETGYGTEAITAGGRAPRGRVD